MISKPLAFRDALPPPEQPAPEEPGLAQRLHACARLLDAAAEELAALESGDVGKRREISEVRDELAREIHPSSRHADPEEAESGAGPGADQLLLLLPQEVATLLAEALYALEERDEEERRMQDRWSSIEGDALKAMQVGGRIVSLRAGRYPDSPRTDARLDLRF